MIEIALVAYGKAIGLTIDETAALHSILLPRAVPLSVVDAWRQLEDATYQIKRGRRHDEV